MVVSMVLACWFVFDGGFTMVYSKEMVETWGRLVVLLLRAEGGMSWGKEKKGYK